jgi:hypothetical protein
VAVGVEVGEGVKVGIEVGMAVAVNVSVAVGGTGVGVCGVVAVADGVASTAMKAELQAVRELVRRVRLK